MGKLVVVAIGGNALVKDNGFDSVHDQYEAVCSITANIADMVQDGCEVVVTHGNGPQVGFAMRRSEIAHKELGMSSVPLVNCVADTQGGIGYMIQQALTNEFIKRGMSKKVATIITQVEVNKDDPNFHHPTKPVGAFFTEETVELMRQEHPEWVLVEDAGRGYRRVVPSPMPIDIIEKEAIKAMIDAGFVVVAAGGGGIPVVKREDNTYEGIDAVIDKDFATSLLADQLQADSLIITTGVPKVCINFGKPNQQELDEISMEELEQYMKERHFPSGSMLPKVEASLKFLHHNGKNVIITNPDNLRAAIHHNAGTHIVKH